MTKARRQVEEKCKLVDIVFELLDARLPDSSRNPMIHEIVKDKPRIVLLNKADLADQKWNERWIKEWNERGETPLLIDAKTGKGVGQISNLSEKVLETKFAARAKKGIRSRQIRAMILGIPNVGKSSLINRLAKRTATQTGDRPGVTKAQQWIRIGKSMELLDTPGILWPKFEDHLVGLRLAASGAIREEILPVEEVALFGIEFLQQHYPSAIQMRYQLGDLSAEPINLLEQIGQKRGCLRRGGVIDIEKAAEIFLQDLRGGRLGRITFERPDEERMKIEEENNQRIKNLDQ